LIAKELLICQMSVSRRLMGGGRGGIAIQRICTVLLNPITLLGNIQLGVSVFDLCCNCNAKYTPIAQITSM